MITDDDVRDGDEDGENVDDDDLFIVFPQQQDFTRDRRKSITQALEPANRLGKCESSSSHQGLLYITETKLYDSVESIVSLILGKE